MSPHTDAPLHAGGPRALVLGPAAVRWRPRVAVVLTALAAAAAALAAVALTSGAVDLSARELWAALTGGGTRAQQLVADRRAARAAGALVVGFALGCAGGLTQTITRNPIASPDVLGITTGAGAAAVLVITRPQIASDLTGAAAATVLVPAALAGGVLTTLLVLALAWRGGFEGVRLVLVGLGVNAIAVGLTSWLLTRASLEAAAAAALWLTGSLQGARLADLPLPAAVVALGAAASVLLARDLAAIRLGRDSAASLGTAVGRTELLALATAVSLVSAATAVAGPVAFVAFMAPQAALRLMRLPGPPPLAGGVVGAVLLLAADQGAQHLPVEVPVGVVTAVVGAAALLALLVRTTRRTGA